MALRRKRFRAALANAGMTQGEWATKQGIGATYLSGVLNGHHESIRLLEKVDEFTARELAKIAEQVVAMAAQPAA